MNQKKMSRAKLLREKSLLLPEVENPFVHRLRLTWADKIQIALMTVTLVPIRLIFIVLFLVLSWACARVALIGYPRDSKKPMSGWRNMLRPFAVLFARAVFFSGGFHWVTVKGKLASPQEASILAMAPHSTYFDALPVTFLNLSTVVAKAEVEMVPLFGALTLFTQPVFVRREDPNSRQNTILEIKRRAQAGGTWPQIIIFPEGTCTNRTCLISFKPGAFIPAVPVQPVCVRYKNKLDTVTWTWEGLGAFTCLWYTLCQFHTGLELEFLPVYTPSEEEKADPRLYGMNVRKVMAMALDVPMTDHTYEDIRLMNYAAKLNIPPAEGLVEFAKLSKKLGMNFDNMKDVLAKYCQLAQSSSGHIDLQQFAEYLGIPISPQLKDMFDLYDRDSSGTINFREYVIGLSLIAMPANTEETIKLAFEVFDKGGKGYIEEEELREILHDAFGMDDVDAHRLFVQVDQDKDGKIVYSEFKAYAEEKPEYASVFTAYWEQREESAKVNGVADVPGHHANNAVAPITVNKESNGNTNNIIHNSNNSSSKKEQ